MPEINWLAVLAAAISTFVLGGLWYSPAMFLKAWQRGAGLSDEQLQKGGHPAKIYGGAFVLSLIAAATFAMFLGTELPVGLSTAYGFTAGLCWVAASFGINYLFERKSFAMFLVNGGYHTVQFTLFGLILSLWH